MLKNIFTVLLGVVFITCLVVTFSYLMNKLDGKPTNTDAEVNQLKRTNDSLLNEVKKNDEKIKQFQVKIDSISLVKNKIQIKYIQKQNEINNYSANALVSEFDSIFANINGIK